MKILFIISSLGSGGAERVVSLLANYLVKNHEITILTLSTDKIFYEVDNRVNIKQLDLYKPTNSIIDKIFNNLRRIKILKNEIKNIDPEIVVSFMTQTNIISIIASKLAKKKIIISEDTNYNFLTSKRWRALRRVVYRYSNGMRVLSSYDYKKYYFVKNKRIIFNPIKIENISLRKENIILAVGRLDYQKGFDRLIKIYSKLKTNWPLIILGEGNERKSLEKLIQKLNLTNRVFLLGRKKNIEDYYSKAKIFALSSRMEGFGNVLAEAMAHGCACIAFDCLTGPKEMIKDGKNGFLVEDNNIEEYVKKLQRLINDEKLQQYFSSEGKKIIGKLNIEKIANEWVDFIKEITCVE